MKSMTGMGRKLGKVGEVPVRLELKSVNHRFCEVNFRAPGKYASLEIKVQRLIKDRIKRGRIDLFLTEEKVVSLGATEIGAFEAYHSYLTNIKEALNLSDEISLSQLTSGVGSWISKEGNPEQLWKQFKPVLEEALDDLIKMRDAEGERLKLIVKERFLTVENVKNQINVLAAEVKAELETKIAKKIEAKSEELKDVDPQRLASEVLFYLDKMDIAEELDRLGSHFAIVSDFIESKEPIGRKMDFLLQEFGREFNTIASKASDSKVAHLVVQAKSELEKVREQIQNIE